MAFEYFNSPTLTPVNISLYGDADKAGIAAGNAQPSTISSIIRGATKGVETGLQIVSGIQGIQAASQQSELRQNQIDMLPTTNAQAEAGLQATQQENTIRQNTIDTLPTANDMKVSQLQEQQAQTQIEQLKAKEDAALSQVNTDMKLAEAKANTAKATDAADMSAAQKVVFSDQLIGASDPETAMNTLNDPKVQQYLQAHPTEYSTVIGHLANKGLITPDQYNSMNMEANRYKELAAQADLARANKTARDANAKQRDTAIQKVTSDSDLNPYYIKSNYDPSSFVKNHYLLEDGSFTKNEDGSVNTAVPANFVTKGDAGTYTMVDAASNMPVKAGIRKTTADKYNALAMSQVEYDPGLRSVISKRASMSIPPVGKQAPTASTAAVVAAPNVAEATALASSRGVPGSLLTSIQQEALARGQGAGVLERMSDYLPSWLKTNQVDSAVNATETPLNNFQKTTREAIDTAAASYADQTLEKLQSGTPEEKAEVRTFLEANNLKPSEVSLHKYYVDQLKTGASAAYDASWQAGVQRQSAVTQSQSGLLAQKQAVLNEQKGKTAPQVLGLTKASKEASVTGEVTMTPEEAKTKASDVAAAFKMNPSQAASFTKTASNVVANPHLSDQPAYVQAVAAVESGGKDSALSPTGVKGLLQVTKATAAQYGLNRDIPEENVEAGKRYLEDLAKTFNGNWDLAYAAYNAGPGVIKYAQSLSDNSEDWSDVKGHLLEALQHFHAKGSINVDPVEKWKETINYPDKVAKFQAVFA